MATDESQFYLLEVTAGPSYDRATHQKVVVNGDSSITIETDHGTVNLCVRIRDYTGLPSSSPRSHSYFDHPAHTNDQYSIAISLVPKQDISGVDLVFGNDFDHPVRDHLPPGTNYALKLVKWMIDPGIEADAYADKPYLYGAALSSWNYFRICGRDGEGYGGSSAGSGSTTADKDDDDNAERMDTTAESIRRSEDSSGACSSDSLHDEVIEEGGEGTGADIRASLDIPELPDGRKRFFLDEQNRNAFVFERGRLYKADFANPYIGFNDFSLRLPGFNINIANYIDKKNHALRYVLKNKKTDDIYFVLLFTLLLDKQKEQSESEESEESELD